VKEFAANSGLTGLASNKVRRAWSLPSGRRRTRKDPVFSRHASGQRFQTQWMTTSKSNSKVL